MTREFWDLPLSLRSASASSPDLLESLLFSLLTLLELNSSTASAQRDLAMAHPRELEETREWVRIVFDNSSASVSSLVPDGGKRGEGKERGKREDERVKMLAASILVRIQDIVDKYQALLMGELGVALP